MFYALFSSSIDFHYPKEAMLVLIMLVTGDTMDGNTIWVIFFNVPFGAQN